MEDFHEGFMRFWETLTGVFDDDHSKLIRISSFAVLAIGIVWAALNYFQAQRVADLETEYTNYSDMNQRNAHNETLDKLMAIAKTVGTMRRGGAAIAEAISQKNVKPFNIAGYNVLGLEDLNSTATHDYSRTDIPQQDNGIIDVPEPPEEQPPELMIKALMLAGKNKYAVINYASKEGHVIRQGQELPGGGGRVVRITKDGITVRFNGKETVYTVK